MLWNAGQKRIAREGRDRLAELFVAARDAGMDVLVRSGQAKPKGTWRAPSYIQPDQAAQRPAAPTGLADRDAMLAQLGTMFPSSVRRTVQ
jgi:hypothetical protein